MPANQTLTPSLPYSLGFSRFHSSFSPFPAPHHTIPDICGGGLNSDMLELISLYCRRKFPRNDTEKADVGAHTNTHICTPPLRHVQRFRKKGTFSHNFHDWNHSNLRPFVFASFRWPFAARGWEKFNLVTEISNES